MLTDQEIAFYFKHNNREDHPTYYDLLQALQQTRQELRDLAKFYGNPGTYFAVCLIADSPCGEIMDDFSETDHLGEKPGKKARTMQAKYGWTEGGEDA